MLSCAVVLNVYSVVNAATETYSRVRALYSGFDWSNWLDARVSEENSNGLASYFRCYFFNCPIFVYSPFHKLMLRFCVAE